LPVSSVTTSSSIRAQCWYRISPNCRFGKLPFLYQVMLGVGCPPALHFKLIMCPAGFISIFDIFLGLTKYGAFGFSTSRFDRTRRHRYLPKEQVTRSVGLTCQTGASDVTAITNSQIPGGLLTTCETHT
jgi:hypothetical protein